MTFEPEDGLILRTEQLLALKAFAWNVHHDTHPTKRPSTSGSVLSKRPAPPMPVSKQLSQFHRPSATKCFPGSLCSVHVVENLV